ncbi:copper resistance protein B [Novosphingobium sp. KA1]|uniref:copper resistance protein B n=1 Tax=Novosphingobium sp. (strain KA1) TaxID=164608 RepID=UPI001A8E0DC0|nr:copper resistance protein B [Novosphingobium sp. KA1]QSR20006.1 hypothetical protein CA833_22925 [Novosphingobium sp. KA1]
MRNARIPAILLVLLGWQTSAQAQAGVSGQVDLFEARLGRGDDEVVFDTTTNFGDAKQRLVLKIEGGAVADVDLDEVGGQVLYSNSVTAATNLLVGLRHEFRGGKDLSHASFGIEHTFANWLSGEHYLWLSQRGDVTGAAQLVGTATLSPRLYLEPRAALAWSAQDIAREDTAAGATEAEVSVRLRRQLGGNATLYLGAIHQRLLGGTRRIARAGGDDGRQTRVVLGFGFNF